MASRPATSKTPKTFAAVNVELWLLLSIFILAMLVHRFVASQQVVLGLYMLPTLFSAYFYGRQHAVLTALASVMLVVLVTYFQPVHVVSVRLGADRWFDLAAWAGVLMITGYTMGTLCERVMHKVKELGDSYDGLMSVLQQLIGNSKFAQNSRLALCATKIAESMSLPFERVEDVRAAALLEDLDKSGIGMDLFMKAAGLDHDQASEMEHKIAKGKRFQSSRLERALAILIAFQDSRVVSPDKLSPEVQILLLANLYQEATSDKSARVSPVQVIDSVSAEKKFNGNVVKAFRSAFV